MANFLDQKEEVIKVELTKEGRKALGLGVFEPAYFSFFDDTIIYDNAYSGYADEIQNNIQDRLLEGGATITSLNNLYPTNIKRAALTDTLQFSIANSNIFNDYSPAWSLNLLNGKINFIEESSSYGKKIFNFNDINFFASLKNSNVQQTNLQNNSIFELDDGKIIILEDDYILIELNEENVADDSKNFEIELFCFDELTGGKESGLPRKLNFIIKTNNLIDGILYDVDELPVNNDSEKITVNEAQYYFDILVDNEIDRNLIFRSEQAVKEQITGIYTSNYDNKTPPKEDC